MHDDGLVRTFDTGATRDSEQGKYDYEGFLSPLVLHAFAAYMHEHRKMPDGSMRDADNWQQGFGRPVIMKSLVRHLMDLWLLHDGFAVPRPETGEVPTWDDALGGLMFNVMAYWFDVLTTRPPQPGR